MKKALVTGGLGFIGSRLVEKLKKTCKVTVVDNLSSSRKDWLDILDKNRDVEYVYTCHSDPQILKRIEDSEFDTIFHVAAIPRVAYSVEKPVETTESNVFRTIKLIDSARKGNISRLIFSSSSSVYGGAKTLPTPSSHSKDPKSPYAWQKSAIEDYIKMACRLYDVDIVSLRYFNVFGPGQFGGSAYATAISAWCHAIKNSSSLRKDGSGEQSRDMCYVDNVVSANLLAANSKKSFKGECYNVACGDKVSNNEILEFLEKKFGSLNIESGPFRPGDVMHTEADISDTVRDLGYRPKVSFWDGLDLTLSWWNLT